MTFWGLLRKDMWSSLVFFAVFLAVGVAIDLLIRQTPINWAERLIVAAIATGAFAAMRVFMARNKASQSDSD